MLCMLMAPFPEAVPALTDLISISEERLSHFLLILTNSNNIIQHSVHFVIFDQVFDCHLATVAA